MSEEKGKFEPNKFCPQRSKKTFSRAKLDAPWRKRSFMSSYFVLAEAKASPSFAKSLGSEVDLSKMIPKSEQAIFCKFGDHQRTCLATHTVRTLKPSRSWFPGFATLGVLGHTTWLFSYNLPSDQVCCAALRRPT